MKARCAQFIGQGDVCEATLLLIAAEVEYMIPCYFKITYVQFPEQVIPTFVCACHSDEVSDASSPVLPNPLKFWEDLFTPTVNTNVTSRLYLKQAT